MQFSVQNYFDNLKRVIDSLDVASIEKAISLIRDAWIDKRQVIVCGNGGSALTSSHYITDWNKMAYLATGRPFRGVSLADNMGLITAYANDVSYEDIYSEQLKNQMDPGDVVVVVSGSGNSPNVVRAVEYANEAGGITLAVCGYDGGKIKQLAQHALWVDSMDMQICEDLHFVFGHLVMKTLCGSEIR